MISGLSHLRLHGGLVPALPSSILEPLWVQVAALLPVRQVHHPLGCHRTHIPDRVVFDELVQVLVFGCGYRCIADQTCSATTLRRRRDKWITLGVAEQLRLAVLGAYDRMLGLELEGFVALAMDGRGGETPAMRTAHRSHRSIPPRSALAGFRFPVDVIVLAVRWYLRFGLSFRDVEELLAERGVEVDHVTVYCWVQRFTPLLAEAARPCRHAVGNRWHVDETYVKVAGRWR
jgi:transposase